ncbi:MAG: hypothetical protein ACOX6T_05300 [Myxococcales bacterium]|jgi:carbonic anhydrase
MSVLDQILAHNADAEAELRPGDNQASSRLCVVTCSDPSVSALLPRAIGIGLDALVLVRVPGPAIRSGSEELCRAVATAVAHNGCKEVLVVAHTDCVLVGTQASAAASALASCGFDRARLPEDVRTFFNLQASPRQIATETASAIRGAGYLPQDLLVHAALLDNASGKLTVLERGEHQAGSAADLGLGVSGFGASAAGPVELAVELPPQAPAATAALDMPRTELVASSIDLKTSGIDIQPSQLDFRPSGIEMASGQIDLRPSPLSFEPPARAGAPSDRRVAPPPLPASSPAGAPASTPRAPLRAPPRPASRPAAPRRAPAPQGQPAARAPAQRAPAPSLRLPPGLLPKIDRVRDFYRIELDSAVRVDVARALGAAALAGVSNADLIKLAFSPILESGPKRYKVIDELLAIKEAASTMEREVCHAVLRQLVQ